MPGNKDPHQIPMQIAFLTPLVNGRSNVQFLDGWNARIPVGWEIGEVCAVAYMLVYVVLSMPPLRVTIFHSISCMQLCISIYSYK